MSALLWLPTCLALTVAIECGAAALLFRQRHKVYAVLLCNLLTNPLVNLTLLLVSAFAPEHYAPALALLEAGALLAEGWLLAQLLPLPRLRALALSLLLNALSFGIGLLLSRTII